MIVTIKANASVVELQSSIKKYNLGLYADYLVDTHGDINIQDLMSSNHDHLWKKNTAETPNFAFSKNVYWLRLKFHSNLPADDTLLFEIAFPLQDYVDYYAVSTEGILKEVHTGDRREFSTREVDYRNFLFPLDIATREEQTVYIRLDTADGLHEPVPMILWDSREFTLQHGIRSLGLGLYFGIMLVMALYNLFVYVSMRDKTYLYYVTYILGFSFWLFSYYGFSFQYLWPNFPNLGNQSTVVLTCTWTIFMSLFVCSFLDLAQHFPRIDRFMKAFVVLMILTILMSFYGNYSLGILSVIGLGVPACIAGIVAGFLSWKAGYRPARFFLIAWSALLISLVIFCLKISGILPTIWVIERSIQIGSAIEVVLLSLGLADRINTLRKEKIAAQKESIEAYESNLKLKSDFITSISHELRTPMNAILGGVELAKGTDAQYVAESLKIIRSGANDMMGVVDDILIHTEIQAGQLKIKRESSQVSFAMGKLAEHYKAVCKERNLTFFSDVNSNVPNWIVTDRHKLTVILTKLLDNAVKFTEQGEVRLNASVDDNTMPPQLICIVSDSGPGVAQDQQELIFDPFMQIEGGFTRRHGGMGIGLSICRRLAESLDGSLKVDSGLGEGSRFTLKMPLEVGEPVHLHIPDQLASADLPILVVEDNIVNQKVIAKMLKKLGFSSLVASHGEEALSALKENTVSLILMDLQMPVMDGFTCTSTIRTSDWEYKDIPIIAVTANVMDQDKSRCDEIKMNDFLEKPLKLNVLRNCLSQYIKFANN
ncbi:hypothetical protein A9Q81_01115 [Gammaproteobacteria bacterium 42_54_T18]|nr:hypothetical protein A9Q81_01115 [Gammaproteobacteria bacterium 42_54_T18]